jgi:putative DNA primase/helicase
MNTVINFDTDVNTLEQSLDSLTDVHSIESIFGDTPKPPPKQKPIFGKLASSKTPSPIVEHKDEPKGKAPTKLPNGNKPPVAPKNSYKKKEKVFIEPIYASYMSSNINIAVAEKNENLNFYNWTGNYWKSMTVTRAQADALTWLERLYADQATGYLARSCTTTAALSLLNKRPMPAKGDDIIIPLKDRWLIVSELGEITDIAPDKSFGITHQINATLGTKSDKPTKYIPKELPEESMFSKFLNSSLPNIEDQKVLQEYTGMCLLPDTRYQRALILEGPGGNGKGAFTEIISAMHENVAAVNLEKISGFGLSELPDASLVVVSETPSKGVDEEQFKQLVSGDKVVIDIKGKSQYSYRPFAKWIVCCNKFPLIKDESDGIWRRLIIIKFMTKFKGESKIMNLSKKIIDNEMLLVLDWALLGLQRLLARGENGDFVLPEHIKQYTEIEKTNSNNVASFINDSYLAQCVEPHYKKEDIYGEYVKYCNGRAIMPFGDVQFWKRINQKFPDLVVTQKREAQGRKYYVNLFFDYTLGKDDEGDNPFRPAPQQIIKTT